MTELWARIDNPKSNPHLPRPSVRSKSQPGWPGVWKLQPLEQTEPDWRSIGMCSFLGSSCHSGCNATSALLTLHLWGFMSPGGSHLCVRACRPRPGILDPLAFAFCPSLGCHLQVSPSYRRQAGNWGAEVQEGRAEEVRIWGREQGPSQGDGDKQSHPSPEGPRAPLPPPPGGCFNLLPPDLI